jgi:hypothetical protein
MRKVAKVLRAFAPVLVAAAGAAWIYPPAGLIVLGCAWYFETRFGK